MTIQSLASRGESRRSIASLLGVSEGAVRYHLRRAEQGAVDRRSLRRQRAQDVSEAIAHYLEALAGGPVNLTVLHEWLQREHDYEGSLRSVQRFYQRHYPQPRQRARRRVETPPGAQAQVDWAEWPRVRIADRCVYAYELHMVLSHSRKAARVWSPRMDQLSWQQAHNDALRRLGGVPAVLRVDNVKTAVSRGAGAWGEINASYRRYARAVRFHVDPCPPRQPQAKGKAERGIRMARARRAITQHHWQDWDELQRYSDEQLHEEESRRLCPATGTSILEAWEQERSFLQPLPLLPEPFDIAVTRRVGADCLVTFERRQYSVPFELLGRRVELRGCARTIQVLFDGRVVAEHSREGRERIVVDHRHYEGTATESVLPPVPLGRMGQRLQQIAAMAPQERPLDLYAALAEVAR